jgi:hypothetical protein
VWVLAGAVGGAAAPLCLGDAAGAVAYPEGYRSWVHVKSTLVGPASPGFKANGGLHHFYANEKAMEGYRTGTWPDGSVLIDDLLEMSEKEGVSAEGARRRVAVMVKDARAFAASGGWGFEVFRGDDRAPSLDAQGKAACHACHTSATRELVFSQYRR